MGDPLLLPVATLWRREMVRFFRQRGRVLGSLLTPALFWLLFGTGYGSSFTPAGESTGALDYFLPGTALLIVLFTSIFANISIIEDRREGFLQAVLVAPVPRLAIVLGKVLGGTTIAVLQALLFLSLAAWASPETASITVSSLAETALVLTVLSVGVTALGFCFAWRLDSVQAFHGFMNLVLMPLWALSGALFPADGAAAPVSAMIRANPVGHGLDWLRAALAADGGANGVTVLAPVAFAAATLLGAVALARVTRSR